MINIQLDGLTALKSRLEDLGKRTLGSIQRKALNAGGQVLAKKARTLAPRLSGTLAKSIAKKVKIFRTSGVGIAIVGPRTKFRKAIGATRSGKPIFREPSRTAGLVEHGTRRSRPQPFVGPAAEAAASAIETAMADKACEELDKL